MRNIALFAAVGLLVAVEGFTGSWNTALGILNMGLISAILALGVNMQWGYAGLFNVGVVGFVALGGLAPVLISTPPVEGAMAAGGWRIRDLGSANGTFVNNKRVTRSEVSPGDAIRLGRAKLSLSRPEPGGEARWRRRVSGY